MGPASDELVADAEVFLRGGDEMRRQTITLKVSTNLDEITEKVTRLDELLKEANSIIQELASTNLEINLDI